MIEDFVIVCGRGEVHKTFFLLFSFFFFLYLKTGGEDGAASARLATGSGSLSGEYLGRGTP